MKSGRKGESYITNAAAHQNDQYGMKSDILSFYDSVAYNKIRQFFFEKLEMSRDTAEILTRMVTYRRNLPTGGKTSMLVAYFAYQNMFDEIHRRAEERDIAFTLYVDDLSFSSQKRIESDFFEEIHSLIRQYGLKAKWKKTVFYSNQGYREYTGVGISNGELVLPNVTRKGIIDCFAMCQKNPDNMELLESLKGKLIAARQIEPDIFPQIHGYIRNRNNKPY